MRRILALAAAVAALAHAPARADLVKIEFDLGASSISAFGGLVTVPPDGTIQAASATVIVTGQGTSTINSGPVTLKTLSLSGTVNANPLGLVTVTGPVVANELSPAMGSLTANLANAFFPNPLLLIATASIQCMGAFCPIVGTFPITLNGTQTLNGPFTIPIGNLGTPGAATLSALFTLNLAGDAVLVNLVGSEVSRTFLPEPVRVLQLGAAGVALAGLGWLRRRRE